MGAMELDTLGMDNSPKRLFVVPRDAPLDHQDENRVACDIAKAGCRDAHEE
jgi:hypothetical protein